MEDIAEPTLLLNEDICRSNIERMAAKSQNHGLRFKPHMKTHQSAQIGTWLADAGVEEITVSSVKMAKYFAENGWDNITIAFPSNIRQIKQINQLAEITALTLLLNSSATVKALDAELSSKVKAYIEIDTGSNRTGLKTSAIYEIKELISIIRATQYIEWIGFYSHPGHSYSARSIDEIRQIHQSVTEQFMTLKTKLEGPIGSFEVCVGDTPCCSKGTQFKGIDAVSPGNFVFYDLMQYQIGSCTIDDIAVALSCPIVDTYPERNELAIHGGAVHFSKEVLQSDNSSHYGLVAEMLDGHWNIINQNSYLKALSQEHGIVKCTDNVFSKYQVGDSITILPVHSCLTANLMREFRLTNGQTISQLN